MSNARARQDELYTPTPAGLDELDRGESVSLEDVMREVRAIREEDRPRR